MICQLGALLSPLLQAGLQIGQQFLNRELGRDARRDQKELIKAQARASGGGSNFVQAQSPGTVSAPFVNRPPPIPVQSTAFQGATGFPRVGGGVLGPFPLQTGVLPIQTAGLNGVVQAPQARAFASGFGERFVLDKASGCLRAKQPGEKGATFKLDRNGDFVRVKPRRINPANKSAAKRASRRIDATINFMSDLVRVSTKRDKGKTVPGTGGKTVTFRTKKRRKAC